MATTLQVLAPYLPYGPSVYWQLGGTQHQLTSCIIHSNSCYLDSKYTAFINDLTPVLFAFEDLQQPALIEIAKLAMGQSYAKTYDWLTASVTQDEREWLWNKHQVLTLKVTGPAGEWEMQLDDEWDMGLRLHGSSLYPARNQAAIIDYLRSKHFALPVNGKPLVEGVDFIRKS